MKYKAALLFIVLLVACLLAIPAAAESDNSKDARLALLRLTKSPIKIERATSRPDRVPNRIPVNVFATHTGEPASSPVSMEVTAASENPTATGDAASSKTSLDVFPAKATATINLTPSATAPPKVTATRTPTTEPTSTSVPTETPVPTDTSTATPLPTSTATEIPSQTPSATETATPTDTATSTVTPTFTSTATATATSIFTSTATRIAAQQNSDPTRTRPTATSTFAAVLPSATPTITLTPDDGGTDIGNPTDTPATTLQETVSAALTQTAQAGHPSPTPTFTATAAGAPVEAMMLPVTAQPWEAIPVIWYFACGFLLIALLFVALLRLVVFKRKS